MLLLTVPFMIPAVYQYMLSQHRDVGSYLKLGGQVVMWVAKSASSCLNSADWPAKTWVGYCPPCPPISYVPAAKVFRAILSSWKTFLWSLVWEAHKYVLLETCYWDSFASAMFLSNPKHALKIFYDLRILPIISQFVLRLLEILGYLLLHRYLLSYGPIFCSGDVLELGLGMNTINQSTNRQFCVSNAS